jgi:hypothetical protein
LAGAAGLNQWSGPVNSLESKMVLRGLAVGMGLFYALPEYMSS